MRRALALVVLLAACNQGGEVETKPGEEPAESPDAVETVEEEPPAFTEEDLPGLVLQPDEAPEALLGEGGGTASPLEDFWPADCCQPQQDAFAAAGFVAAQSALYELEDRSDDPSETGPGLAFVSSSAVLFQTPEGAAQGMTAWIEYFADDSFVPVDAAGLGEEGFGSTGTARAPEETLVLYHWRVGNVVLHLRAGGGGIAEADVRPLADAMQSHVAA